MKQLRKEMREEVDKLEEEKDEVQRLLAKLRTTKRQLERDVDSLQVISRRILSLPSIQEFLFSIRSLFFLQISLIHSSFSQTEVVALQKRSDRGRVPNARDNVSYLSPRPTLAATGARRSSPSLAQYARPVEEPKEEAKKKKESRSSSSSSSDSGDSDGDDSSSDLSPASKRRREREKRLAAIDAMKEEDDSPLTKRRKEREKRQEERAKKREERESSAGNVAPSFRRVETYTPFGSTESSLAAQRSKSPGGTRVYGRKY